MPPHAREALRRPDLRRPDPNGVATAGVDAAAHAATGAVAAAASDASCGEPCGSSAAPCIRGLDNLPTDQRAHAPSSGAPLLPPRPRWPAPSAGGPSTGSPARAGFCRVAPAAFLLFFFTDGSACMISSLRFKRPCFERTPAQYSLATTTMHAPAFSTLSQSSTRVCREWPVVKASKMGNPQRPCVGGDSHSRVSSSGPREKGALGGRHVVRHVVLAWAARAAAAERRGSPNMNA